MAGYQRKYANPLSLPFFIHTTPNFRHLSRKFMPRYQRIRIGSRIKNPRNIGAADPRRLHGKQNFIDSDIRNLYVFKSKIINAM